MQSGRGRLTWKVEAFSSTVVVRLGTLSVIVVFFAGRSEEYLRGPISTRHLFRGAWRLGEIGDLLLSRFF